MEHYQRTIFSHSAEHKAHRLTVDAVTAVRAKTLTGAPFLPRTPTRLGNGGGTRAVASTAGGTDQYERAVRKSAPRRRRSPRPPGRNVPNRQLLVLAARAVADFERVETILRGSLFGGAAWDRMDMTRTGWVCGPGSMDVGRGLHYVHTTRYLRIMIPHAITKPWAGGGPSRYRIQRSARRRIRIPVEHVTRSQVLSGPQANQDAARGGRVGSMRPRLFLPADPRNGDRSISAPSYPPNGRSTYPELCAMPPHARPDWTGQKRVKKKVILTLDGICVGVDGKQEARRVAYRLIAGVFGSSLAKLHVCVLSRTKK
ncbi:hypothetical protein VTN00DRAFT_5673 [Thermoascus crustaceus]|uniref:uncharacterized protein n=1 Tax=Thermoascus crustaceus TaxID=5088 RepID=UPI0037437EDC